MLLKMWGNKLFYFVGLSVNWYNLCEEQIDNIYEKILCLPIAKHFKQPECPSLKNR